jgi:tryptophanyl-tRNA synthetase
LKDETKKMSKSEPLGCLFLTDGPKESFEKIMKAKTDSYTGISYEKNNRPSLANLIEIMAALKGDSPQGIADKYEKYDHRYFKEELAFEYSKYFDTFRGKYSSVTMAQIKNVIELGASEAQQSASSAMEIFLEALNK